MSKAEKVFDQEFTARNFNTSPLTISGLQGDTYDYELVINAIGLPGDLQLQFNADATSNYREYIMEGLSSSIFAFVADSATPNISNFTVDSFGIFKITGSSGSERYMDVSFGRKSSSLVMKSSYYWKNTVDDLSSLVIKTLASGAADAHIILYRTPKAASQAKWELVKNLSWSASSTEQSITSLLGDTDLQYRLVWQGDQELNIELNNDAGSNYTRQYLQNAGGSISAANSTTNTSIVTDGIEASILINAESGVKRLCTSSASNTSSSQQSERAIWWSNTADEVTGIYCTPAASATGTAKLYRKINPKNTADTLNFETIETVDISGDFSAGHTFSNLKGDSQTLYKIEFIGDGNSTSDTFLRIQFNSDTGSNYSRQILRSYGVSADANSTTDTYVEIFDSFIGALEDEGGFTFYMYPKSGDNRPYLWGASAQYSPSNYLLTKGAGWWLNSINEITSIKVYGSNTNSITGTLKLSRLK